jgi:hypothetical protein
LAYEEGRVELGQVRYNEGDRRWERFDGQDWTAIAAQSAAAEIGIIVYESTDNAE